jgi:hypothetical protein
LKPELIGTRKGWEEIVKNAGIVFRGHRFLRTQPMILGQQP